jgi:type I restriction enzyme S subunit
LAPAKEQNLIVSKIEELFSFLDAGITSLQIVQAKLKRHREAVLKHAFEGKLTEKWRIINKEQLPKASSLIEFKKDVGRKHHEFPPVVFSGLHKLPIEWAWIRLGEISERMQYGTSEKACSDLGIPVLRMGNIKDGKLDFSDLKYFPNDWENSNQFLLQDGDILFNRTNSSELVGKAAIYLGNYPKAVFASYLIRLQIYRSLYSPYILTYFINSFYGRKYIQSVVSQQVGQANVNGTKLSLMPIPLMSVPEQIEMKDIIERCLCMTDKAEGAVTNGIKQERLLRKSILREAFEGRLVTQIAREESAEILLKRIEEERVSKKIVNNSHRGDV